MGPINLNTDILRWSPQKNEDLRKIKKRTNLLTEEQTKLPGRLWNRNSTTGVQNSGRYSKRNVTETSPTDS